MLQSSAEEFTGVVAVGSILQPPLYKYLQQKLWHSIILWKLL